MQVTDKQRKMIWAGAAGLGVLCLAPHVITSARQAVVPQEAIVAKPSPMRVAAAPAPPPPDPVALQAAATAAQFGKLMGNWSGGATLPQGMCRLGLQLRTIPDKPGGYSGYSTMICNPSLVLLGQRMSKQERDIEITKSMTPTSAIMSGSVVNGEIVFHIDKAIGTPLDGCIWTGFTVSPFADQIAAQWQAGTCQGGQMVLNRVSYLR